MKVFLYYPHLVIPSIASPYPSLPLLSAFLRDNSRHEVLSKDINADVIGRLIELDRADITPARVEGLRGMTMADVEAAALRGLRRVLPDLTVDPGVYEKLKGTDYRLVSPPYLLDYWNLSVEQLQGIIDSSDPDPIVCALGPGYFGEIPSDEPVLVGISVAFATQFGPAVSLARRIKAMNPRAVVAVGGGIIRRCSRHMGKVEGIFDSVDCFIQTEGEEILVRLADRVEGNRAWRDVPGLVCRDGGGAIIRTSPEPFQIQRNGVPAYAALLAGHYYLDRGWLGLRTSVGCYWDRCRFCTQALNRYQARRVESVVCDMEELHRRFGATGVRFTDEAVPVRRLSRIADLLIARNSSVSWTSNSRFDGQFTEALCHTLIRSGCTGLSFGLESINQRVNNLMDKGVDVDTARNTIDIARKSGLFCFVNAIIGFPGETEAEMLETVGFLNSSVGDGVQASLSIFTLNFGSYVYQHPEEFGVTWIEDAHDYMFKDSYLYACEDQVPYDVVLNIFEAFLAR